MSLLVTTGAAAARRRASRRAALLRRADSWERARARAERLGHGSTPDVEEAFAALEDYRLLASDLARARELLPDSRARAFLEATYALSHRNLQRGAAPLLATLRRLVREQLPEVVRRLRGHIVWVSALFVLAVLAGAWLIGRYPGLIGLFASPDMIATVERGELWTDRLLSVVPAPVLSLQILTNNIVVSLFAFCAGFLFGLGTFYVIALNGLSLGALWVFTTRHGLGGRLLEFMVAHGCVELACLCLAGAAGAAVGEALARPQAATRAEAFQRAALDAGKLLVAVVILLVGCGLIEGFLSPARGVPLSIRIAVGVGYFLVMLAALGGWPRARPQRQAPSSATSS